jgi:hypothetical protein
LGLVAVGGGKGWRKGVGGWIWYKYYVHVHINGKMRPVEIILGMGCGEA